MASVYVVALGFQGDYDQALALLGAAKRHFGVHPRMPYKVRPSQQ